MLEEDTTDFKCATANVLSLFACNQRHGAYVSSRQEALLRDCRDKGLHCIGLQETRSRLDGCADSEFFHILSAPATSQGVGGIQLWLAKQIPCAQHTVHLAAADLRILHSNAQRMVVRIDSHSLKLLILVLHAPSSDDASALQRYWRATTAAIPSRYHSWNWIILADANARVGQFPSNSIGNAGAQDDNAAGTEFHHWLLQHSLWIPQTFPEHHHDDIHTTWIHGTGAEARLDYIALSTNLRDPRISTHIGEVDLAIRQTDHRMVSMVLPMTIWPRKHPRHRPRKPSATMTPTIEAPPTIEWNVDVHTHARKLQRWAASTMPEPPKRQKRKTHLREETWANIQLKKFHYQRMRQIRQVHRAGILREIFNAWRHPMDAAHPRRPWLQLCDRQFAVHQSRHQVLCHEVALQVKADDAAFYAAFAAKHGGIAADEGLTGLWRSLRPILPRQLAKRKNNSRCRGPDVHELADHYCRLECGLPTTYPSLLEQCHSRQRDSQEEAPLTINLHDIPSIMNMERIALSTKKGKAPGLDTVTINHLQCLVERHASAFFELYLKAWILAAEPLSFKGGYLASIAKKQGVLQAAAMRGIMLLDTTGKVYHAMVRAQLLQWAAPRRCPAQFGGFKGQQCSFASLLLRGYCNRIAAAHMSNSVLFVDVRSAFHCLLRQHLFNGNNLPAELNNLLQAEGLNPELLNDLACEHSQWFLHDAPPSLARVANDAHINTWYTLPGAGGCYETLRGSRPGSPLADLVYNTLTTSIMKELQPQLDAIPGIQAAAAHLGMSPPLTAWVDDLAVVIPCMTADDLIPTTTQAVLLVQETFNKYGLSLNFSAGKTEVLAQFRGKRSVAHRREHFIDNCRLLDIGHDHHVRIVTHYQHLGATFAHNLSLVAEIKHRLNKATNAFRSMRRVLLNRQIAAEIRLQLLEALVFPVLLYGAGSWHLVPGRLYATVQHAMIGWQRRITGD